MGEEDDGSALFVQAFVGSRILLQRSLVDQVCCQIFEDRRAKDIFHGLEARGIVLPSVSFASSSSRNLTDQNSSELGIRQGPSRPSVISWIRTRLRTLLPVSRPRGSEDELWWTGWRRPCTLDQSLGSGFRGAN